MKANQSIKRAFALLRAAAREPDGATVTALAVDAGIPRATASRLLATLGAIGLVQRLPDNDRYVLGYELIRLGRTIDPEHALLLATRPVMERLVSEFRETVTLAVPRPGPGYEVICQLDAPRAVRAHDWSTDPQPLHATSTGKLILAELLPGELTKAIGGGLTRRTRQTVVDPDTLRAQLQVVRRQGWAEMIDELEEGLTGVAVPLRDHRDQLVAAIGMTAPTQRMDAGQRARVVGALKTAVDDLQSGSADLASGANGDAGR